MKWGEAGFINFTRIMLITISKRLNGVIAFVIIFICKKFTARSGFVIHAGIECHVASLFGPCISS